MNQPTTSPYQISDFVEWNFSQQLDISPKFQRRDVWIPKAKSYLVDTIVRSMPIPPLFIRLRTDPVKMRSIREVIDGQQRLRSILGFIKNEFPLLGVHNTELADMFYADLPEQVQRDFLSYKLVVSSFDDISDSEVLSIFARINTYTARLTGQELRNAEFFGAFKQTVYTLALQHYAFWKNNRILSDSQIARMAEAELVSELIVSMLSGIGQTKDRDLKAFYNRYDDAFPEADKVTTEFEAVMDLIGDIFNGTLQYSPFRRVPLFYSLFCAIYDAKYGLPESNRPRLSFDAKQNRNLLEHFLRLGKALVSQEPPPRYSRFVDAARRRTADAGTRRIRHEFIWDEVLLKTT